MKENTTKEMDILPHENIMSLVVDLDLEGFQYCIAQFASLKSDLLKYSMIYMIVLFGLLHSLFYPFFLICLFPHLFIKIPNKPTVIHKLHQKDSPGDWKILVFTVTNRALRP
jgi:hypothetical protein